MKVLAALGTFLTLMTLSVLAADSAVNATNQTSLTDTNELVEPDAPGKLYTNSIAMQLIQVPGGFWAGKYEVTQKQYQKIMGENPSAFGGDDQPVENVNWINAMAFCEKMTAHDLKKKSIPKGYYYTLPTEDEWTGLVGNAALTDAVTSLGGNFRESPSAVGSLAANDLGLYDVRGNVMEFCLCDSTQAFRYLKGGSWRDFVDVNLRSEFRWYCTPDETKDSFGFRCILKSN